MSTYQKLLKKLPHVLLIIYLSILCGCSPSTRNARHPKEKTNYWVAAYVWPSQHNDERGRENYKIIVDRIIKKYFSKPNYFKINGEPVFSVFSMSNLALSFNGLKGTREALDYMREEVKKAGFPGLHIQAIGWTWGYGYLEAIKKVMSGKYNRYH